jgi:UDP-2-acetamido-2-deoxy-ribo-hexuluronate aminotransferase
MTVQNLKPHDLNHPIPFMNLKAQQERIRPQLDAAIKKVLDHGSYIMGPEVYDLENQLAQ